MRLPPAVILLLLLILPAGCGQEPEVVPIAKKPSERALLIKRSETGPVALVMVPHPIIQPAPADGVRRALACAVRTVDCTAAVFIFNEAAAAEKWLLGECARRRKAGITPRIILGGHSLGATAAAEIARHVLRRTPDVVVLMLVTVDAIKTGPVGATTGMASTVLTLGNPIPGKHVYFFAYDSTPRVDGRRMLAHVNYYQLQTKLYHGKPIRSASENHQVVTRPEDTVNHGNVDDYAFPMILSDFRHALRQGVRP